MNRPISLRTTVAWVNAFEALPAKNGWYFLMIRYTDAEKYDIRTLEYTTEGGWNTSKTYAESPITFDSEEYDEVWWAPVEAFNVHDH